MKLFVLLPFFFLSFSAFSTANVGIDSRLLNEKLPYELTKQDLAELFGLSIQDAASKLQICTTLLKKLCRKQGIERWPHRELVAVTKKIKEITQNPEQFPDHGENLQMLEDLKARIESGERLTVKDALKKIRTRPTHKSTAKPADSKFPRSLKPQKTIVKKTKDKSPVREEKLSDIRTSHTEISHMLTCPIDGDDPKSFERTCNEEELDKMSQEEYFQFLLKSFPQPFYSRIKFSDG